MVLVDRAWARSSLLREVGLVCGGAALIAVGSHLEIPLRPVPLTAQTLFVLLLGAVYGSRRALTTVTVYLGAGLLGLPVFAGGGMGLAHLLGPSGGYLLGFLPAAGLTGWLAEQSWDRRLLTTALAMGMGNLLIYAFGVPWLAVFTGWATAISAGLLPFLIGDALKIALAALILPSAWALIGRRQSWRG